MTELTIVSGGPAEPSSTRLLADRLAASAPNICRAQGFSVKTRVVELRPLARSIADAMTHRVRQHRAGGGVRDASPRPTA